MSEASSVSSADPRGGRATRSGRGAGGSPPLRRIAHAGLNLSPHRLLFGPVFWKDTAISARKKGTFAFRGFYMALLIVVVLIGAIPLASELEYAGPAQRLQAGSQFAGMLAQIIQWTQFVALMIAGPILASGAISHERTSRSLDSLYATPITPAQIMWGKLSSRMLQVLVLAVMPLPILLMLRAMGGIEASVTLQQAGLTLTAATMTTSMALFASVHSRRPWAVITSTMTIVGLVHLIGPALLWASSVGQSVPGWALKSAFAIAPGFPFAAASFPSGASMFLGPVGLGGVSIVGLAAVIHLLVAGVITSVAALMLQKVERPRGHVGSRVVDDPSPAAIAGEQSGGAVGDADPGEGTTEGKPSSRARKRRRRSRGCVTSRTVGDMPVLWRELRQPAIDLGRFQWLRWIIFPALGIGTALIFFIPLPDDERPYEHVASYIILFAALTFYLSLASLTRTTPLIPHERSARTWDVLRTTPLRPSSIVIQKYAGSMARIWLLCGVAVLAFTPSVLLGQLHWSAMPFLLLCLAQITGLLGATGLLMGSILRMGLAATGANLGVGVALWVLLPIAIATITNDLEQPLAALVNANPAVEIVSTLTGCIELSPNERGHYGRHYAGWTDVFEWPDEQRTLGQHATILISNTVAYAGLIIGSLVLATKRLNALLPGA
ncbi:MAG: ABC transporter permease [Phycisphaerales bacterium]